MGGESKGGEVLPRLEITSGYALVSEYCVFCQIVAKLCIYNKFSIFKTAS